MRRASISEAKRTLSALLSKVRAGDSVLIEDRGVPVARIEPLAASEAPEGRLARLARAGLVRAPRAPTPEQLLARRPPGSGAGTPASQLLVAERRSGR